MVAGGAYPAGEYSEATAGIASVPAEGHTQGHTQGQTQGVRNVELPELPELPKVSDFAEVSGEYVAQMQAIAEQMATLNETYSEHMQDLNRNVSGLNTIYEIQLKSISSQLETIDHVNRGLKDIRDMYEKSANESSRYCEETEKMARYMRQLNAVYEKMITAMTINMHNPMMGGVSQNPFTQEDPEQVNS